MNRAKVVAPAAPSLHIVLSVVPLQPLHVVPLHVVPLHVVPQRRAATRCRASSCAPRSAPAPLPTERDPLRAGEGREIGYTFQEACALTRSSVPSQRMVGLQIIGRIVKLARR